MMPVVEREGTQGSPGLMEADDESFEGTPAAKEDDRDGSGIVTPHGQAITTYPLRAGRIK